MITPQADQRLLRTAAAEHADDFIGRRLAEWSNLNLLDNVPKVNGAFTLQLREQKEVEALLYNQTNQLPGGLLDFLSVAWITSPSNAVEWIPRDSWCPWVTCGQKPVFAAGSNVLQALMTAEFKPRQVVYLPLESQPLVSVSHQTDCRIVASHFSSRRVGLEVEASEASLLVIAQTFYHPWRASIDGQRARLLRANHAFQALEVPAGHHHVAVVYTDRNLCAGAILSGCTALVCLLLWIRRRSSQEAPANARQGDLDLLLPRNQATAQPNSVTIEITAPTSNQRLQ